MKGKASKLFFSLLLGAFLLSSGLFKKVDKIFSSWDRTDSPGCALGIIKDGKLIYAKGYGMANLDYNIPITPKTVFRIASTSKQFTAMCIALLEEEGKLFLEDSIRKYIPELPDYASAVKIKHLIYHTSGFRDYLTLQYLAGKGDDDFYTAEEVLELLARQKALNFKPGDEFLYSNTGYFLLGVIVERVTGKTLAQFAKENIFDPLGMKNTHFHDDHTMIVKNRATGYAPAKNGFKISETSLDIVGDGAVFTTVEDLYLWDQNFYHNRLGKGGQKLIERILTPGKLNSGKKLNYAFGLMISRYRGLKYIHHGGSFVGFRAQMMRFPQQHFTVIVLANLSSINPTRLCLQVADLFLEKEFTEEKRIPARPEPVKLSLKEKKKFVGTYYNEEKDRLLRISLINSELIANYDGYRFRLIPVSYTKLMPFNVPFEMIFELLDGSIAVTTRREKVVLKRIEPPQLNEKQLKEYEGDYFSGELMAFYKIKFDGKNLKFQHRNAPKGYLFPILPDKFKIRNLLLSFLRDNKGKVKGFYLSAGRVKNILFLRKKHCPCRR